MQEIKAEIELGWPGDEAIYIIGNVGMYRTFVTLDDDQEIEVTVHVLFCPVR